MKLVNVQLGASVIPMHLNDDIPLRSNIEYIAKQFGVNPGEIRTRNWAFNKVLAKLRADTISFADTNPDTILDSGNGFTTARGFANGQTVKVFGSVSNDGEYLVNTRTNGTLTLDVAEALTVEAAGAFVALFAIEAIADISKSLNQIPINLGSPNPPAGAGVPSSSLNDEIEGVPYIEMYDADDATYLAPYPKNVFGFDGLPDSVNNNTDAPFPAVD